MGSRNEVVHALVQHFDEHDLSNRSVPTDVLGRAYEYLIKRFAADAGAKAGEFSRYAAQGQPSRSSCRWYNRLSGKPLLPTDC